MKAFIKHISKHPLCMRILVRIFAWYIKCVHITTRWQVIVEGDVPPTPRFIFTCWHGRILMASVMWRFTGHGATPLNFIVSPSTDGTILKYFLQSFGFCPLVGSSGSGTGFSPFKNAIKVLNQDKPFAIAPDGSRGPVHKVKDGLGFLALKQQVPVVVCSFNTSRRRVLNSWDKMLVPKLFARGVILIKVLDTQTINGLDKDDVNAFLERELNAITMRSDGYFERA